MDHLRFRPLEPGDLPWLERCRDYQAHPFTALSPQSLLTWAEAYGFTVAGDDDFFVIHSQHDRGYYAPCGDPEKCARFMEQTARSEEKTRFIYLTEGQARALADKGWSRVFRADLSEYILSTDALSLQPDAWITHSFRDKCRVFARDCAYQVREVGPEEVSALRAVAETALLDPETENMGDGSVLRCELDHFQALRFRALLLETERGPGAFFMGYENGPGEFTMTMTRRDPALSPAATSVCIHEFAKRLADHYPVINLEEDLGLEGLRRAKNLLSPVDLLKVYEVVRV